MRSLREVFRRSFYLKKISIAEKAVLVLSILGMGLAVLWWSASSLKVTHVEFEDAKGKVHESTLPASVWEEADTVLDFTVKIHKTALTRERVRIIPDDELLSLVLNGKVLDLNTLIQGSLADWRQGFSYPLGDFLRPGENTLVFTVLNVDGIMGIDIYTDFADRQGICIFIFFLFCLMGAVSVPLRRVGVSWGMVLMVFTGFSIWCGYVFITPWVGHIYDIDGHVQYIEYVLQYWRAPDPGAGWVFYHPPLYYFSAAGFWKILDFFGLSRSWILKAVQFQSLVYVLGFVFFSFMTIRLAGKGRFPDGISGSGKGKNMLRLGLLLFWPSVIIHSARIGNDSLFYVLAAASFYFVVKWWLSDRIGHFQWAAFFAALGMLTKSNAIILFFVMGLLFLIRFFRTRGRGWRLFFQQTWLVVMLFIVVVMFNYAGPFFDVLLGKRSHLLVGNLGQLSGTVLEADNTIRTYVFFDVKNFLDQPYTSTVDDDKGRRFFWNFLLKTGLFGEHEFSRHSFVVALVRGLSCGLIFILLFPFLRFARRKIPRGKRPGDIPMAVLGFLFVASAMAFRISAPFSPVGDFRYILPVLVPVIYFYCAAIDDYQSAGWEWAAWAGRIMGWGFCVLSGVFMLAVIFQ